MPSYKQRLSLVQQKLVKKRTMLSFCKIRKEKPQENICRYGKYKDQCENTINANFTKSVLIFTIIIVLLLNVTIRELMEMLHCLFIVLKISLIPCYPVTHCFEVYKTACKWQRE